jgi:diguanylate cyclase (GGDEF)-like protein
VQDITERKRYEKTILSQAEKLKKVNEQLAELATKDSLTNVANRRSMMSHFEIMLAQASRNGQPISVIMTDIDNFKTYNDAHGHPAGDEVLKKVCNAIIRAARRSDIVARYGGEEFVVLLPDTDSHGARQIAERCRETIEHQDDINQTITASFGVSTIVIANPPNTTLANIANHLIAEADRALYFSKAAGKNKVTHYSECEEKQ